MTDSLKVEKIWLTDAEVWIRTSDGREACERFEDYPRLRYATRKQRERFESDEIGIHWPDINEDLCFEGFFDKRPKSAMYRLFLTHPELNVSAVARRLGMSQSLMAQYIGGSKKPSQKREQEIRAEIRRIGEELASV